MAKEAAAAIRKELKQTFPGTKFSVVTRRGGAIDIEWVDGVHDSLVEKVVSKYEYGSFNGMTDCYEYSNSRSDIPQVKYVFTKRIISYEKCLSYLGDINKKFRLDITISKLDYNGGYIVDNETVRVFGQYKSQFLWKEIQKLETEVTQ